MSPLRLALLVFAPCLAACGGIASSSDHDASTKDSAPPTDSIAPESGGQPPACPDSFDSTAPCSREAPCTASVCTACSHDAYDFESEVFTCVGGKWSGQFLSTGDCFDDGPGTFSDPKCTIPSPVDGGSTQEGGIAEGGVSTFACGPVTCTAPGEYCYSVSGGPPPPPDSGPFGKATCIKVPSSCEPSPTCACIEKTTTMCFTSCKDTGGAITAMCEAP